MSVATETTNTACGTIVHAAGPDDVALYRLYGSENELLYVGVSKAPLTRWNDHQLAFWWHEVTRFEWVWHPSREAARAEEKVILASGIAKYNIHGTPSHGANWKAARKVTKAKPAK